MPKRPSTAGRTCTSVWPRWTRSPRSACTPPTLEIIEITGQPLSTLHAAGQKPKAHPDIRIVSLEPSDRSQLHARIAQRFAQMLEHGFIDEVKHLHARPELHAELPAMRTVGYRQVWQMLDGERTPDTLFEAGVAATRQLAKRQLTWLRSLPVDLRLDCLRVGLGDEVMRFIEASRNVPVSAR